MALEGLPVSPQLPVLNGFLLSLYEASCSMRFIQGGDPRGVWPPLLSGRWAGKQVRAGAEGPAHFPQGDVGTAVDLHHRALGVKKREAAHKHRGPCPGLSALSLTKWPFPAPSFQKLSVKLEGNAAGCPAEEPVFAS